MTSILEFSTLIERHYLRVIRVALGYTGDIEEAKDVAHDAMVKACLARDTYRSDRPFFPWMYRIVKNTCLDVIKKRRQQVSLEDANLVAASVHPIDKMTQEESQKRLAKAMVKLNEQHREVLILRHFQDLSYQEIGSLLSIPKGTVMSRLYRARVALNQCYKEEK